MPDSPQSEIAATIFFDHEKSRAKNWAKNWAKFLTNFSGHFRASFTVQNDSNNFHFFCSGEGKGESEAPGR